MNNQVEARKILEKELYDVVRDISAYMAYLDNPNSVDFPIEWPVKLNKLQQAIDAVK